MKKIKILAVSLAVSVSASAAFLAATALIIAKAEMLPKGTAVLITTVIGCMAVFLSALVSSSLAKENGAITGLLSALLFLLVAALVAVFGFDSDLTGGGAGRAAAFLLSGIIGGILGVNHKKKIKF